ncbi:MAG: hypothetical protein LBI31_07485, partial [Zoogloeaceae bacterium]|nr:hypothetical protein [Zoogloeaceae bacterium]
MPDPQLDGPLALSAFLPRPTDWHIVPDAFYPNPTGWAIGGIECDQEPFDAPQLDGPIACAQLAGRTPSLPVASMPRALSGFKAGCFFNDYYYRVHVTPDQINFGNIVTTTFREVSVWNADFVPHTASRLDGIPEGVILEAPAGNRIAPWRFNPLEEYIWTLTCLPSGASVLQAEIGWGFDIPSPSLIITGSRIQAWPFLPDWTDSVTERLSWLTDVLTSIS